MQTTAVRLLDEDDWASPHYTLSLNTYYIAGTLKALLRLEKKKKSLYIAKESMTNTLQNSPSTFILPLQASTSACINVIIK